MGSPFKRRSALKHDILDNNSQPWKHDHTKFGTRGVANVNKPLVPNENYLLNANKANKQVNTSNNNSISAAEQQYNQSKQIADLYNSGRLNPEGFNTQASYYDKIKNKGNLSIKNGNVNFRFPGNTKSIGSWMDNTQNINYNDGDDGSLTAPSTQYTPEQINSILGESGMASFVPDGNGGFTFESGAGGNTYETQEMYKGPRRYSLENGVKVENPNFLTNMPEGYSLQPPPPMTNNEMSLEERKAMLEEKKAKILAARAASSNAAQQTGMPRPITTRNRY